MLNTNENYRIIEKLKKSLDEALEKLYKELEFIEQKYKLRQELSEIDSIETLACLDETEILQYMFLIDSEFKLEQSELEKNIIFYSIGATNPRFKTSPRYIEAEESLKIIKNKFDEYVATNEVIDKEKELTLRTTMATLENLYEAIGPNNEILGEIDELHTYLPLLDEKWTDEEKIILLSILVKSHIENLINGTKQHLEEIKENQRSIVEHQATIVETEMQQIIAESKFNSVVVEVQEEAKQETQENLHSIELSKETLEKIEELKQIIKKSVKELLEKSNSNTKKTTFDKLKAAWCSEEMTYEDIYKTLKLNDLKLFLAYCISTEILDIEVLINNKYKEEELIAIKELITDSLKTCTNYAKLHAEVKKMLKMSPTPTPPITPRKSEEAPIKLIFYTVGDGESEFEKSLKGISKGRLDGCESLLSKLEQGNFKTATVLAKGNDSKLKYVTNHNVFITFKVLPNNHVLVFHIAEIDTINKKNTDSKLNTYSTKIEKKISEIILDGTRFEEGTQEYRQLIDENKSKLETIKNKLPGAKRGDSRA